MSLPEIVSRGEWRAARAELLLKEKAATRARDALNAERRGLPMVEVDEEYVFEGGDGKATLFDLFEGRRQLVVYHFMFAPEWDAGCRSCSGFLDQWAIWPISRPVTRRSPSCPARPIRGSCRSRRGWAGRCPGTRRTAAASTATSR